MIPLRPEPAPGPTVGHCCSQESELSPAKSRWSLLEDQHQDSRDGQLPGRSADRVPSPPRGAVGCPLVVRRLMRKCSPSVRSYDSPRVTRMISVSLCLDQCSKLFSDAAAIGEDQPGARTRLARTVRSRRFVRTSLAATGIRRASRPDSRRVAALPKLSKRSPRISTATCPVSSRSRTSPLMLSASGTCRWA